MSEHTPPHAAIATPGLATVAAIGRQLRALFDRYDALDRRLLDCPPGSGEHRDTEAARDLAGAQLDALADLALAQPAASLADAAVQAALALDLINDLCRGAPARARSEAIRAPYAACCSPSRRPAGSTSTSSAAPAYATAAFGFCRRGRRRAPVADQAMVAAAVLE